MLKIVLGVGLRRRAAHDVASSVATTIIVIHAQVMAHLMSQHGGEIRKTVIVEL